jgi:predicted Zn finger-like uncharacterized protein
MSTIVACPSCSDKLRVPDELQGQKVRCPSCSTTFDAVATPPGEDRGSKIEDRGTSPPASEAPGTSNGWKELPLELAGDGPAPAPPSPPATPGLVGAVEIKLSLDDEESGSPRRDVPMSPPESEPPAQPERPVPPPRLADEHDDLRTCPSCGKSLHRDATRCYHCGESLGRMPRLTRDPVRRDCEPHRGSVILTLGIISLVTVAICLAPVGVALGLTAWIMGGADLRKIRAKQMDPEGYGTTQAGWVCGIIGTALNTLVTLGCALYFLAIFAVIGSATPVTRPSKGAPPPPWQQKGGPPPWPKDGPMEKDKPMEKEKGF